MSFAAVTFIYSKKVKIIPTTWILGFDDATEKSNKIFYCYWNTNLQKDPVFDSTLYSRSLLETKEGLHKALVTKLFGKLYILKSSYFKNINYAPLLRYIFYS